MSGHEEYLLIHAFYTLCIVCFASMTALGVVGILKVYYPNVYARILVHLRKKSRVARWERAGDFGKIVKFYRAQAKRRRRYRLMFLGMANLYENQWEQAVACFQSYIDISVGKNEQLRTKNYLAVAHLQGGQYSTAYRLLEECRHSGKVHIIPYVLSLLLTDKATTARDFYDALPAPEWVNPLMKALVSFDKHSPGTFQEIQRMAGTLHPVFYLYASTIREIINRYETELYFENENSCNVLRQELNALASEISNHQDFFESPRKQWLRKAILEMALRVPERVIWCDNLERVLKELVGDTYGTAIYSLRWLSNQRKFKASEEAYIDFFYSILPKTANKLIVYERFVKYELFKDERVGLGFQFYVLTDRWDNRTAAIRMIPLGEVTAIHTMCNPLLRGIEAVPSDVKAGFHRVLYDVFINRNSREYWKKQVLPFIDNMDPRYQLYFEEIRRHFGHTSP